MPVTGMTDSPRIGLALGSGAARGWSHIGAIEVLEEMGITPDVITGCSIGSVIGGFYAMGKLDELRGFAEDLTMLKMADYLDVTLKAGGVMGGRRLMNWFELHFEDTRIEDLEVPFGAIAVDIRSGREIWLREGSLSDALRASIALPGLLTPWQVGATWLSDGGLVNPVPISLAQALGAEVVIAVDINGGVFRFHDHEAGAPAPKAETSVDELPHNWLDDLAERLPQNMQESTRKMLRDLLHRRDRGPQQYEVISNAVSIMSNRITKARSALEPADVMISPDLGEINAMQFYKAAEAMEAGRAAARRKRGAIEAAIGYSAPMAVEK